MFIKAISYSTTFKVALSNRQNRKLIYLIVLLKTFSMLYNICTTPFDEETDNMKY